MSARLSALAAAVLLLLAGTVAAAQAAPLPPELVALEQRMEAIRLTSARFSLTTHVAVPRSAGKRHRPRK